MLGGLAALAAPSVAWAAGSKRSFELLRGGNDIGFHTLTATETGGDLIMDIVIEIRVKVLGITAYLYEHENRETWRGGELIAIDAKTNADGNDEFCRVARSGEGYKIDGSAFSGDVAGQIAPTSYWNFNNFGVNRWVSTQSGKVLDVVFKNKTTADGGSDWNVTGPDNFETNLVYDASKEWRGCSFDARGTDITYTETAPGPRLLALL